MHDFAHNREHLARYGRRSPPPGESKAGGRVDEAHKAAAATGSSPNRQTPGGARWSQLAALSDAKLRRAKHQRRKVEYESFLRRKQSGK